MSPSEFDLRAALHEGEDDGTTIDVGRIVAGGVAARARRRTQLATAAAVVVFVGAAGSIGAVVLNDDGSSGKNVGSGNGSFPSAAASSADAPADRASKPAPSASSSPSKNGALPPPSGSPSPTDCPSSFPNRLLPGGGSSGQFGAGGPLFPSPAVTMVICSYGPSLRGDNVAPGRLVLTGSDATALQNSLESASKTSVSKPCPTIRTGAGRRLAFVGVDASGKAMRVVTTTLTDPPCNVKVTNGTSIRFDWHPPTSLQQVLLALEPGPGPIATLPSHSPSGKNHGSPVR